ncbi:hypothetical protein L3Y34_006926 [Caenorhabditis briggsae]|uniref:F-box domain-containing protein n=1 Tax=Caenorhabditis briggsae TaxID=6238 RepID=A0AAE9A2N3_CAEBR|nr:hypothetical protein L3Y34_006926 [Caenorhabditis briggsae]
MSTRVFRDSVGSLDALSLEDVEEFQENVTPKSDEVPAVQPHIFVHFRHPDEPVTWQTTPNEMKIVIVKFLDYRSRQSLRRVSRSDKLLVDTTKFHVTSFVIKATALPNFIFICSLPKNFVFRSYSTQELPYRLSLEEISIEDARKVIKIFVNKKILKAGTISFYIKTREPIEFWKFLDHTDYELSQKLATHGALPSVQVLIMPNSDSLVFPVMAKEKLFCGCACKMDDNLVEKFKETLGL